MTDFEAAEALRQEIMEFMQSCGGIYEGYSRRLEERVIISLASDQYILYRDAAGKIEHYLCYWKVRSDEIQDVLDGVTPVDIYYGSVLFVAEHGNKAGMKSMRRAIRELRHRAKGCQGLIYNHAGEGFRIFAGQKGA
ncbi:hypothetical protein F6V30_13970 [Oryzomonas sagensis]|uniref:Uncharacterized protein n=1 Tax=Oryzomonas sagensis TaxID=2603857 RepID=A0ABQ6TL22_9BACT|nr:hypothetical protein [Oryzomonas sagensis]KAB0668940.1 hypothetical protein F6V30_13970 [Oryzomonas sagensis]